MVKVVGSLVVAVVVDQETLHHQVLVVEAVPVQRHMLVVVMVAILKMIEIMLLDIMLKHSLVVVEVVAHQ